MNRPKTVLIPSLIIVLAVVIAGAVAPVALDGVTKSVHAAILANFGWGYLIAIFLFLVFVVYLALSPLGKLRLGKDWEKPQYSYLGWFSMLFAAGMGIGLVFWGVAEPLHHFGRPPGYLEGGSGDAAHFAMVRSFFHWGIHPWAVYILMALSIAYFSFRRGMAPLISSVFFPLIGDAVNRWPGRVIDTTAVFATVFGVATSLGLGALQIRGGLAAAFGIPDTLNSALVIVAVVTVLYLISSLTGLDKGIRILSSANVMVTLLLMTVVLVLGPTSYIFNVFVSALGSYVSDLVDLSLSTNPFRGFQWTQDWTLFYWAWWISWSPFVGLFIASISRGRTIREFVFGALLVPTVLTFFWFAVFGGTALHIELYGSGGLGKIAVENVSSALFVLLQRLPATMVLTLLALIVLSIFFITSADSATYVLAMMTSGGTLRPASSRKIIWGVIQSGAAVVLLVSGGLEALQRMAIIAALPFAVIMFFMMHSLHKALRYERDHELQE